MFDDAAAVAQSWSNFPQLAPLTTMVAQLQQTLQTVQQQITTLQQQIAVLTNPVQTPPVGT
jgi:hypothetical protein